MGDVTVNNLDDVFSYHKPTGDFQIEKYHRIRTAAKLCAQAILGVESVEIRAGAIAAFRAVVAGETGACRDRDEALAMIDAADFLVRDLSPEVPAAYTQDIIRCLRAAVMWTNASVALAGRI